MPHKEVFAVNKRKLVRCLNCGLLYFKNFNKVDYNGFDMGGYIKEPVLFYYYQNIIADIIMRYKKKGSLFDVGGGIGVLMDIMRKKGWDVEGIEASKQGVEYAERIFSMNMFKGDFLNFKTKKRYDVITANHVIEHVNDLNSFLKKIGQIIKKDGIMLLGLPNAGCLEFKIFRKRWISLAPDMHIWHFNPKTITKLLEKNNFKVVKMIVEQPKRKFSTIPKKIIGHALHEPFRLLMNFLGTGANMFVIGVKNG